MVAQGEADMGIVQIIRGADAHVVDLGALSPQFIYMPVETLKLCKEMSLGEVAIQYAYTIKPV